MCIYNFALILNTCISVVHQYTRFMLCHRCSSVLGRSPNILCPKREDWYRKGSAESLPLFWEGLGTFCALKQRNCRERAEAESVPLF